MILRTIATGSSGNSHALISNDNEILLLDLGVGVKEIKRKIDYRISDVVGAVVTHSHLDHSRSVKDFEEMGIDVYKPYESKEIERKTRHFGSFTVSPLPMLDKEMRVWQHSNADKSECPCYGFYIKHPEMGSAVYITDTKCVVWNFSKQKLNHIIISANYGQGLLCDDEAKRNHVLTGHLSIQEVCRWIDGNKTNALRNVILCHMSRENIDPLEAVTEVRKIAPAANADYADKGKEWELNELPF